MQNKLNYHTSINESNTSYWCCCPFQGLSPLMHFCPGKIWCPDLHTSWMKGFSLPQPQGVRTWFWRRHESSRVAVLSGFQVSVASSLRSALRNWTEKRSEGEERNRFIAVMWKWTSNISTSLSVLKCIIYVSCTLCSFIVIVATGINRSQNYLRHP